MVEDEKIKNPVEDDFIEDLEEEFEKQEMEELEQLAKEVAEEEKKRQEELRKLAAEITLADVIECIEKIRRYIEVSREATITLQQLMAMYGDSAEDEKTRLMKMFLGKMF